jgi:hypothetical protein
MDPMEQMCLNDGLDKTCHAIASRGMIAYGIALWIIVVTLVTCYFVWAFKRAILGTGSAHYTSKSYEDEFRRMRRAVLERDGHRCTVCGCGGSLDVHHIVPRSRGGTNAPSNLVTLCPNHHRAAHHR